jgi:hypothetical protein
MSDTNLNHAVARAAIESAIEFMRNEDIEFRVEEISFDAVEFRANLSDGALVEGIFGRIDDVRSELVVHYPGRVDPAFALSWNNGEARIALGSRGYGSEEPIVIEALSDFIGSIKDAVEPNPADFIIFARHAPTP